MKNIKILGDSIYYLSRELEIEYGAKFERGFPLRQAMRPLLSMPGFMAKNESMRRKNGLGMIVSLSANTK